MKQLLILAFLFIGVGALSAQSKPACCAGKEKTACAKKTAEKACCSKGAASCSKADKAKTGKAEGVQLKGVNAGTTAQFKVYGVCGMCKRTIESALSKVAAVQYADWNVGNKMLTVSYDEKAISIDDIKAKVAEAGYDSDTHRATDEAYNNLHGCCKYERPSPRS
jgi:copper chaperone CopZ